MLSWRAEAKAEKDRQREDALKDGEEEEEEVEPVRHVLLNHYHILLTQNEDGCTDRK